MKTAPATGELNQRIKIMVNADIDDVAGGTIPGETTYWETSAKASVLKSQRTAQANQEALKPSASFIVRNRDDKFINEAMVLIWRGERFNILSAEPDYVYKEWLVITAKSVALPAQ